VFQRKASAAFGRPSKRLRDDRGMQSPWYQDCSTRQLFWYLWMAVNRGSCIVVIRRHIAKLDRFHMRMSSGRIRFPGCGKKIRRWQLNWWLQMWLMYSHICVSGIGLFSHRRIAYICDRQICRVESSVQQHIS